MVGKDCVGIQDPLDSALKGIQATQVHMEFREWDLQALRVVKGT